jgi:hypothetical protein
MRAWDGMGGDMRRGVWRTRTAVSLSMWMALLTLLSALSYGPRKAIPGPCTARLVPVRPSLRCTYCCSSSSVALRTEILKSGLVTLRPGPASRAFVRRGSGVSCGEEGARRKCTRTVDGPPFCRRLHDKLFVVLEVVHAREENVRAAGKCTNAGVM